MLTAGCCKYLHGVICDAGYFSHSCSCCCLVYPVEELQSEELPETGGTAHVLSAGGRKTTGGATEYPSAA